MSQAVIISAVRTPIGKPGGSLKNIGPGVLTSPARRGNIIVASKWIESTYFGGAPVSTCLMKL